MTPADTVVLLKGQSQYDTMRDLTADIAEAFRRRGLAVAEVDGLAPDCAGTVAALVAGGRVAFFYGMNGWGLGAGLDLRRWCDGMGVPFVAHLFDHPLTYLRRLLDAPANTIWLLHDETCADFIDGALMLPGRRVSVPVGGPIAPPADGRPAGAREIAILFPGSGYSSATREPPWISAAPGERKVMDACFDLALHDNRRPLHEIMRSVFALFGVQPMEWRADWVAHAFTLLDNQLRVERRAAVVKALLRLPIHVYGHGWDHLESRPGGARFHAPAGFRQVQALMAESRIVLNVLPCVVAAPHDRIFYSTMAGAACATDRNAWIDRHYVAGQELCVFDLPPDGLADALVALLADRERLEAMAAAGRARTQQGHTWLNRVDAILAAVSGPAASGRNASHPARASAA